MRKALAMLCGAFALIVGSMMLASPASATPPDDPAFEHGSPEVTAHATDVCGEIELVFTNPTPWLFVFDVRIDGESAIHGSVAPGVEIAEGPLAGQQFGPRWNLVTVNGQIDEHETTQTFEFDESVEVRLAEGAEQKLFFDWMAIDVSEVDTCVTESPSPTPTATTPSPTPTSTVEPSATPSVTPDVDEAALPVTGSSVGGLVLGGLVTLLVGGSLVGGGAYLNHRRKQQLLSDE